MDGTKSRVNPLDRGALTADDVKPGAHIICWRPGVAESTQHLVIINGPYTDGDGSMVVEVRHRDGHESIALTSEVGLTADRYTGEWSVIAREDEGTDD